jgi:hypothetical protein
MGRPGLLVWSGLLRQDTQPQGPAQLQEIGWQVLGGWGPKRLSLLSRLVLLGHRSFNTTARYSLTLCRFGVGVGAGALRKLGLGGIVCKERGGQPKGKGPATDSDFLTPFRTPEPTISDPPWLSRPAELIGQRPTFGGGVCWGLRRLKPVATPGTRPSACGAGVAGVGGPEGRRPQVCPEIRQLLSD